MSTTAPQRLSLAMAAAALLILSIVAVVTLVSGESRSTTAPPLGAGLDVAQAVQAPLGPGSASPVRAIAAHTQQEGGDDDWRAQQSVVIHADTRLVDLRVQAVNSDGVCRWFSVNGRVEETQLVWRAGNVAPALRSCE